MMRTLDKLTTPKSYLAQQTCNAVSGALIGAATLKSANGAISSALASYVLPSSSSPRTRLITSIGFAAIKTAIDHYLPNQPIFSICAALLPVLGLAHHHDVAQMVSVASLGLLGTYVPPVVSHIAEHHYQTVALAASIGSEVVCSISLGCGVSYHLWPQPGDIAYTKPFPYLSVGLATSFIATRLLCGPHNLYLHSIVLTGLALVSTVVNKPQQDAAAPLRHAPPPQHPQPPQRVVRRDPPAAVRAVAPPQQRRFFSFSGGVPDDLKDDPIFRLFKCSATNKPIYYNPCAHVNVNSLFEVDHKIKRQYSSSSLIQLPKVAALLDERRRLYLLRNQTLDRKFIREAHDELVRICPRLKIIPELKKLLDNHQTPPLMFPMENDDSSSDSDTDDLIYGAFPRPSVSAIEFSPLRSSSNVHRGLAELLSTPVQPVERDMFADGIPALFADDCIFSLFMKPIGTKLYFGTDVSRLPKLRALIDERQQMYQQGNEAELPSLKALSEAYEELRRINSNWKVPFSELNQLIDLKRSELRDNNSSDNSPPASPMVANSNHPKPISFAEGIPSGLEEDLIFRLFGCGIDQGPSCDLVLDPTDKKTFYNRKSIQNWLGRNQISPQTRGHLTLAKLVELPNVNRLITERQEFYKKSKLPVAQALNTLPQNLICVREALVEMEAKCSEAEACAGLRSIEKSMIDQDTTQWNFVEKIPPQLRDDCVFKLFISEFTDTPIYNCVLDPDKKTFYESEWINTCLINRKNSPATGLPLKKEDLIPLSQVSLLVHQRQKFFKGLVEAKTPIEKIREHQKGCTDKKLLATVCEELKRHCGANSEIYQKLAALE